MLNILVLGLSDRTIEIIKGIRSVKRLNFMGVLCTEGSGVSLATIRRYSPLLEELEVPLLRSLPEGEDGRPDLVLNMIGVPKDQVRKTIGDEVFSRCSVMSFPAIDTFFDMVRNYINLKEMRAMLSGIFDATQDAISVVDEKGRNILVNRAYTRLTGLPEEDVIGKPATVDIAEGESLHMKVLEERKAVLGVTIKVGPKKKEVVAYAAPIIVDGQLRGSVGVIHDVSEIRKLTDELNKVKQLVRQMSAKYTFDDLITESSSMKEAKRRAADVSRTPATVLLVGESGTGKELFAHAIHNASPRAKGPFIRVNCSAITDTLMESELFGYVDGAFTGAKKGGKKGFFEEASGGTLFLDEIGKMGLQVQAELLRVLQEKEITRVGDTRTIQVDVRIIVATNTDLESMVRAGTFRDDLYYRLNVVPITIPPLRDRKEDIPVLARHLLRKFNQEYGRAVKTISDEAVELLQLHAWPGNVRELENIIGRAMINVGFDSDIIEAGHIVMPGLAGPAAAGRPCGTESGLDVAGAGDRPLKDVMEQVEKEVIRRTLEKTGGNKTEAAKRLGIAIRNLYYKLDKYKIQ
jgi:PAS domain S-box-containing protein